jgi:hypothetical protein
VIAAILGLIAYSTLAGVHYRVKVCMSYAGRSACKTVSAASEEAAQRTAIMGACADIAAGVTDTMNCQQTQPQSIAWLSRPAAK